MKLKTTFQKLFSFILKMLTLKKKIYLNCWET